MALPQIDDMTKTELAAEVHGGFPRTSKHKGGVMARWQALVAADREEELRENGPRQDEMIHLATEANRLARQAVKGADKRGWFAIGISVLALLVAALSAIFDGE